MSYRTSSFLHVLINVRDFRYLSFHSSTEINRRHCEIIRLNEIVSFYFCMFRQYTQRTSSWKASIHRKPLPFPLPLLRSAVNIIWTENYKVTLRSGHRTHQEPERVITNWTSGQGWSGWRNPADNSVNIIFWGWPPKSVFTNCNSELYFCRSKPFILHSLMWVSPSCEAHNCMYLKLLGSSLESAMLVVALKTGTRGQKMRLRIVTLAIPSPLRGSCTLHWPPQLWEAVRVENV